MRKILAMMMVMLIAVTAAFAADAYNAPTTVTGPSSIKLNIAISQVFDPKFEITYGEGGSAVTTSTGLVTVDGLVSDDSGKGSTELFKVIDRTKVNRTGSFSIAFSLAKKGWTGNIENPAVSESSDGTYGELKIVNAKNSEIEGLNLADGVDNAAVAKKGTDVNSVQISYTGHGVDRIGTVEEPINGEEVASFAVTWTGMGNVPAQSYSATVSIATTAV